MNRAYSTLTVKSVDEETREIRGIASTPSTDRMGDIVEPLGARFQPVIPLLWQHDHSKPIGTAELSTPNEAGIGFTARLAKIAETGPLKELIDMAWQSIKAQLVRGVSIGFKSIEHEYMKDGGIRFREYEIFELSAVTIPANMDATIQTIRSLDRDPKRPIQLIRSSAILPTGSVALTCRHGGREPHATPILLRK